MTTDAPATPQTPAHQEWRVREILRQVIDPEAGVNIVALGLVYRVGIAPDSLTIEMTMTSPACPMSGMIVDDVRAVLAKALPEGTAIDIRLVWEPPWNPSMMNEAARRHFGWEGTPNG